MPKKLLTPDNGPHEIDELGQLIMGGFAVDREGASEQDDGEDSAKATDESD